MFSELIQRGIDSWTHAGDILAKLIDKIPNVRENILEKCPHLTLEILYRFEAIGRKQLVPQTLMSNSPGMERLRLLSYDEQTKWLKEPIPVVFRDSVGKIVTSHIMVDNLTLKQAISVIKPTGVRGEEWQRRFIPKGFLRKQKPQKPKQDFDWEEEIQPASNKPHRVSSLSAMPELPVLPKDDPTERLEILLETIHVALMKCREALYELEDNHPKDTLVVTALGAVGRLRLAVNEGDI